jgi:hypothetical protein
MKNNHPVLVLLAITVITIEAAVLLLRAALVPLLALAITLSRKQVRHLAHPTETQSTAEVLSDPDPAPTPAAIHPLATLATELQQLPVTRLRQLAGIRSKRHTKHQLTAMICAMPI